MRPSDHEEGSSWKPRPAELLQRYWHLFGESAFGKPVVDLACGDGHNGLFLAQQGLPVLLVDRSDARLASARRHARQAGLPITIRQLDLETEGPAPLPPGSAGGILVFRFLHRPLIPVIKSALETGGILIYETFTRDQARYGRPVNPDYLLRPAELKNWFAGWDLIHYFEGTAGPPARSIAQIVCRKPISQRRDLHELPGPSFSRGRR